MISDSVTRINNAIKNLNKPDPISLKELETWLLQNKDLNKYAIENRFNDSCFHDLPCSCSYNNQETRFTFLYDAIWEIKRLHQYEAYFKKELKYLENHKFHPSALKECLQKNKKLGTEDFIEFWLEWYCEESQSIKPFILHWQHLNLSLRVSEWKNTIDFLQKFNALYY